MDCFKHPKAVFANNNATFFNISLKYLQINVHAFNMNQRLSIFSKNAIRLLLTEKMFSIIHASLKKA